MARNLVAASVSMMFVFVASQAFAADRVKAGRWETTLTMGSATPMRTEYCVTAAEAGKMNGDAATLRKYLQESTAEKTNGRCALRDVKIKGKQTIVTIACGRTEVVGTTTYHGDRYEATNSDGSRVAGKRVGDCR